MSLEKVWKTTLRKFWMYERPRVNPKHRFGFHGHFLIKAEGEAKNYKRDHRLLLAWRSFTVAFVQ